MAVPGLDPGTLMTMPVSRGPTFASRSREWLFDPSRSFSGAEQIPPRLPRPPDQAGALDRRRPAGMPAGGRRSRNAFRRVCFVSPSGRGVFAMRS